MRLLFPLFVIAVALALSATANLTLTVLNPPPGPGIDDNEVSDVLRLVFGSQSFLLAGDAGTTAEGRMLTSDRPVAAHSSRSGTTGTTRDGGAVRCGCRSGPSATHNLPFLPDWPFVRCAQVVSAGMTASATVTTFSNARTVSDTVLKRCPDRPHCGLQGAGGTPVRGIRSEENCDPMLSRGAGGGPVLSRLVPDHSLVQTSRFYTRSIVYF